MIPFALPRDLFNISCTNQIQPADLNVVFITDGKYADYPHNHKLPKLNRLNRLGLDINKPGTNHLFEFKNQAWLVIVPEKPHLKTGSIIGSVAKNMNAQSISIFKEFESPIQKDIFRFGIAAGINDALYAYKTNNVLQQLTFFCKGCEPRDLTDLKESLTGSNLYRDLLMRPSNQLGPEALNKVAENLKTILVVENGIGSVRHRSYSRSVLANNGFNLLNAVGDSKPSDPAQLITLEYHGRDEDDDTLDQLIVCKGICFDTGGVSIKPSASMINMKMDMGGSALGLGLIYALAMNKIKLNITLVIAAAYNNISETSMNLGDVYSSGNTTVEITNSDAEDRLALADGIGFSLDYLKLKPDHMVTLATLTGAAKVAVGSWYTPFCTNKAMGQVNHHASNMEFDPLHQLPLMDGHLKAMQNSQTADLTNNDTSASGGGVSTAAAFIGHFVPDNIPWMHLDFSNTAKGGEDISGNPKAMNQASGRCFWPMYEILSYPSTIL